MSVIAENSLYSVKAGRKLESQSHAEIENLTSLTQLHTIQGTLLYI